MGEGPEFEMFLASLNQGLIIYDPAPKLEAASTSKPRSKARSQFRIGVKNLKNLYRKLEQVDLKKE
jgi:MvaI/BcnI restriction endonuclease family